MECGGGGGGCVCVCGGGGGRGEGDEGKAGRGGGILILFLYQKQSVVYLKGNGYHFKGEVTLPKLFCPLLKGGGDREVGGGKAGRGGGILILFLYQKQSLVSLKGNGYNFEGRDNISVKIVLSPSERNLLEKERICWIGGRGGGKAA